MAAFQQLPGWERFIIIGGLGAVAVIACFFIGAWIVAALNDSRG